MKLLEDNIIRYEQKRQRDDYLEEERRKKKIETTQFNLTNTLKDQMAQKKQNKLLNKEINDEYMKGFNEKA